MRIRTLLRSLCAKSICAALAVIAITTGVASANNVEVSVRGGSLYVYGDNNDNELYIYSNAPGVIVVESDGVTKINGGITPVTLRGWNGGVFTWLYRGDDYISFGLPRIDGALHVDLGPGHDSVNISPSYLDSTLSPPEYFPASPDKPLYVRDHILVIGSDGDDYVSLEDVNVRGNTTIDLGAGDDFFVAWIYGTNSNEFGGNVLVLPGTGEDETTIYDTLFRRDITVDDPIDSSTVSLIQSSAKQNVFLFGSNKNDLIEIDGLEVSGLLKVLSKDGDDLVQISNSWADRIETFSGSGNDIVVTFNSYFNKVWAYLENGNDYFSAVATSVGTLYLFGGAGDDFVAMDSCEANSAYLHGESGYDVLISIGNLVDTLRTYTFEFFP